MKPERIINDMSFLICLAMISMHLIIYIFFPVWNNYKDYLIIPLFAASVALTFLNINAVYRKELPSLLCAGIIILLVASSRFLYSSDNISKEAGTSLLMINLVLTAISFNAVTFTASKIKFILSVIALYSAAFLVLRMGTESFYNTNTVGIIMFVLSVYAAVLLSFYTEKKYAFIVLLAGFGFCIYVYQCRSALLGIAVFLILFLSGKRWLKKTFYGLAMLAVTAGSLAFVFFFLALWRNYVNFKLFFSDKSLYTGREHVWSEFYYNFTQAPFFGTGIGTMAIDDLGWRSFTPHNSIFNILVVYGLPVLLLFIVILYFVMKDKRLYALNSFTSRVALCGLTGLFITAFFETILISHIFVTMIWFLLVIINSSAGNGAKSFQIMRKTSG